MIDLLVGRVHQSIELRVDSTSGCNWSIDWWHRTRPDLSRLDPLTHLCICRSQFQLQASQCVVPCFRCLLERFLRRCQQVYDWTCGSSTTRNTASTNVDNETQPQLRASHTFRPNSAGPVLESAKLPDWLGSHHVGHQHSIDGAGATIKTIDTHHMNI